MLTQNIKTSQVCNKMSLVELRSWRLTKNSKDLQLVLFYVPNITQTKNYVWVSMHLYVCI